jgi:hypothetical protein
VLLATEGVELSFTDGAVRAIASAAEEANQLLDNIGGRPLLLPLLLLPPPAARARAATWLPSPRSGPVGAGHQAGSAWVAALPRLHMGRPHPPTHPPTHPLPRRPQAPAGCTRCWSTS